MSTCEWGNRKWLRRWENIFPPLFQKSGLTGGACRTSPLKLQQHGNIFGLLQFDKLRSHIFSHKLELHFTIRAYHHGKTLKMTILIDRDQRNHDALTVTPRRRSGVHFEFLALRVTIKKRDHYRASSFKQRIKNNNLPSQVTIRHFYAQVVVATLRAHHKKRTLSVATSRFYCSNGRRRLRRRWLWLHRSLLLPAAARLVRDSRRVDTWGTAVVLSVEIGIPTWLKKSTAARHGWRCSTTGTHTIE